MKYWKILGDAGEVYYEDIEGGFIFEYIENQVERKKCSPEQFYRFVPCVSREGTDTLESKLSAID